jgi:hypothetical protein
MKDDKYPGFALPARFAGPRLFRMPVDLRIDTDGKTENKRIEVVARRLRFRLRRSDDRDVLRSTTTVLTTLRM